MIQATQTAMADRFSSLHQAGNPLVLYNIWDAGSAIEVEKAGASAIATGSHSVAAAHGYEDGENIPMELLRTVAERICASCSVPVSIDFEGAYSTNAQTAATNVQKLIDVGVVGINFEDQIVGGSGLHSISEQCARISAIRAMAEQAGISLFINARTDMFLQEPDSSKHREFLAAACERQTAYADAGASGFFVPALAQPDLIKELCDVAVLPINVMASANTPSIQIMADLGVSRVSFGPGPYRNSTQQLALDASAVYTIS